MAMVSPPLPSMAVIRRALEEFKLPSYDDQILQIQDYIKILLTWNDKLNLTAIRDPLDILHRHFCESMLAGISVPIERGRLADVGTGAGFPGLPLKILRPSLQVFLIESKIKKAALLPEVIRLLGTLRSPLPRSSCKTISSDLSRFPKSPWTHFVPGKTVSRGTFKRGRRTRHRTVPRGTIVLWLEPVSCKYGSLSSEPSLGISSLGFCST